MLAEIRRDYPWSGCLKGSLWGISAALVMFRFLLYVLAKLVKTDQALCLQFAHFLCIYYTSVDF